MAVKVEYSQGLDEAGNAAELESILDTGRSQGLSEFWISPVDSPHPAIALLVNGELSVLCYFPRENHAGFISSTKVSSDGTTAFRIDSAGESTEFSNAVVLPFSTALTVAKEFFVSSELPKSIEWLEL